MIPSPCVTEAIVLGRSRSGETSLLLELSTPRHGPLTAVAKGALGPSSFTASTLDVLQRVDLELTRSARSRWWYVRSASLVHPFAGLRTSSLRWELACYFGALTKISQHEGHAAPEIHQLLQRALEYLEGVEPTRRIMAHFERRLLSELGMALPESAKGGDLFPSVFLHGIGPVPTQRQSLMQRLS
jgi:DNA repair protein RecO